MKNFSKYTLFVLFAFLSSCKQEIEKPKVIYEEEKNTSATNVKKDSSQIKIADLPIHMEGTKYLIHAIGDVRVYDGNGGSYGSSKTNSMSYAISNYNRFEVTGYFENLKFQHIDSTALRPLTDKNVQIQTATYLNTISDKTKKQILVYSLVDSDTNRDGKLDANDIKTLYISNFNGTKFTKLSDDLQELLDWNVVEVQNRLYFRTIEDINKNGAFDKNDKVHYHFVNLLSKDWSGEEYEPIKK
ncbi:hypothetical protein FCR2A7T_18320 [Flavobacterium cauense R2A-7]|uniref:EF-hand domain-containing protein n=1 Tax=Flavobacterium cauense R2A-7 TaxID=1341154 RepID=V6S5N8_9FLAO|nr:hypothetical protein [Flavobacterium cauense]ESU19670.1 hypothetical protein FCR2A7T_18320 [Flavobacterium cauense R2A-7]KGO79772.1 hypothetical protein Q762_13400 [Flavobacterium cauense R2A-7]TWI09270.1 hypothetical protein IP98_02626 [Flavobacterium cauense R2A-7]